MFRFEDSLFATLPNELLERIFYYYVRLEILSGKGSLAALTDKLTTVYLSPRYHEVISAMFALSNLPDLPSNDIILGQVATSKEGRVLAITTAARSVSYLTLEGPRLQLTIGKETITLKGLDLRGLVYRGVRIKVSERKDAAVLTETDGGAWIFFKATNWSAITIRERSAMTGLPASRIALGDSSVVVNGMENCFVARFDVKAGCLSKSYLFMPFFFTTDEAKILVEESGRAHAVVPGIESCIHIDFTETQCKAVDCKHPPVTPENCVLSYLNCGRKGHIELRRMTASFTELLIDSPETGYEAKMRVIVKDTHILAGATLCDHELLVLAAIKPLPRIGHCIKVVRVSNGTVLHELPVMFCNGPPMSLLPTDLGLMARHSEHGSARVEFIQWRLWPESFQVRETARTTPLPLLSALERSQLSASDCFDVTKGLSVDQLMRFSGGEARIWDAFRQCSLEARSSIVTALMAAETSNDTVLKNTIGAAASLVTKERLEMSAPLFILIKQLQFIFSTHRHMLEFTAK